VGDKIEWNICGKRIKCKIVAMDQQNNRCKIDRHNTRIEFENVKHSTFFSIEEQKDIYMTSLADMIRK
jgi:hypothetical protein